ncbi:MAG: amino acid ABC transporter permease [Bifidobacteriaceae bacterium]|nr:amino acid ABC transporter permease [Bifidobacteriaceae bacterium]
MTQRGFIEEIVYILDRYGSLLAKGAGVTMLIALTGTVVGLGIGLAVGTVRSLPRHPPGSGPARRAGLAAVNAVLAVYIEVFRGTPMMVQAMVVYYGLKEGIGLDLDPIPAGILIVSINTGAYMSEIVRGGIGAVDPGQTEAGQALGMSHWQIMRGVVLPQTLRNILPATGNEFVINIKDTSVLNIISVTELFFQAKSVNGITYRAYETFTAVGVIYLVLTFTTTRLLRLLERHLDGPDNFTLATSSTMPESILPAGAAPGAGPPSGAPGAVRPGSTMFPRRPSRWNRR